MDKRIYYILGFILIVAIIFGLDFSIALITDSGSDSLNEWTMFGRTLNRNAWDGVDYPIVSGLNNASYLTSSTMTNSMALMEGILYVHVANNRFYFLNASNISQVISMRNFAGADNSQVISPVIYGGGTYAGCTPFTRFNSSSGVTLNSYNFDNYDCSSPIIFNGFLYIVSNNSDLYQLNATNVSQIINSHSSIAYYGSTPAIANGFIYVYGGGGKLNQLNVSNISQMIASFQTSGGAFSSSLITNGFVYVGSNDNNLYQLNATNVSQLIAIYTTSDNIDSSPSFANGFIYVGSNDDTVYQLNASNVSQLISSYTTGNDVVSTPVVKGDYVYVGSVSGKMYQLNATNISELINYYDSGSYVSGNPLVTDDYLYFGTSTNIYQLNLTDISLVSFYPVVFSDLVDNSGELTGSGIAKFNATIETTNGTVYLNIDGTNYSATNLVGDIYHYNLTLTTGSYNYSWIGYGSLGMYGVSDTQTYVVNAAAVEEEVIGGGSSGVPNFTHLGNLGNDTYQVNLSYGGKVIFNLDSIEYNISLVNIDRTNNEATLKILPLKEEIFLKPYENEDIDLNKNGIKDINLGLEEISDTNVEVGIVLKRKLTLIKGSPINIKGVAPIDDKEEKITKFETFGSSIFGWIADLFNTNKIKCKKLRDHTWSTSLNFCINDVIKITTSNKKVLEILKDSVSFEKSFVQIETIIQYDCVGCFYVELKIDGSVYEYYLQDWKLVNEICIPITCSELGYKCGEMSDGCGRTLNCGKCNVGYFCANGRCIPEPVPLSCIDSDGGENYFVKGESMDRWGIENDRCEENILVEAICERISTNVIRYNCPNGCEEGVCLSEPWCMDNDLANDIFIFGITINNNGPYTFNDACDVYLNNQVTQYYCRTDQQVIGSSNTDCTFDCVNGVCVKGICADSDLNDSTIKGVVTDFYGAHEDYCGNSLTLFEGLCSEEPFGQGSKYITQMISCPYGCEGGKCIESTPKCSDSDGINFYNQGTIDYLKSNGEMGRRSDSCSDSTAYVGWTGDNLGIYNFDFNCPPEMANIFPYYGGKMYECPEGCLNGACIVPIKQTSYCNDEGYCKLYLKEYLVFDEFLVINADYIFTNEDLAIGFDYDYSYPQKTNLLFSLGSNFSVRSGELNEWDSFDYNFSSEGFFWMNITILNLFSNQDSSIVYDTVAIPYVEFVYDIPDYQFNTKKRMPSVRTYITKPVPKSSIIYETPTVLTKIKNFVLDIFDRGNTENSVTKIKPTLRGDDKPILK